MTDKYANFVDIDGSVYKRKFVSVADGVYVPQVYVEGVGPDRELVVSTYRCKTSFAGASVGDTITATQIIEVSGSSPSTISTVWRNQTTATDLSGAPNASTLELTGTTALTLAQLSSAGLGLEATQQSILGRLPAALTPGLFPVDGLATPTVARVQATSSAAASITLTPTCRRVSMYATQGTWYSISGTATASSHYIAAGERLDFDFPASTTLSVLRETIDGSIRITELV